MRNRVIAIVLIFGLLSINMMNVIEYMSYRLNKKYITDNFCINKNKPQLRCEGKCYLAKKLKQALEKEQKQQEENLKSQLQIPIVMQSTDFTFNNYSVNDIYWCIPTCIGNTVSSTLAVFHPPQHSC